MLCPNVDAGVLPFGAVTQQNRGHCYGTDPPGSPDGIDGRTSLERMMMPVRAEGHSEQPCRYPCSIEQSSVDIRKSFAKK